jgi:hypothetical protein
MACARCVICSSGSLRGSRREGFSRFVGGFGNAFYAFETRPQGRTKLQNDRLPWTNLGLSNVVFAGRFSESSATQLCMMIPRKFVYVIASSSA